jgi:hypothetical protein
LVGPFEKKIFRKREMAKATKKTKKATKKGGKKR